MNKNWQEMYERNKEKFRCKVDLESYFTGEKIVTKGVHELSEGQKVNLLEPFSKTNVGEVL